MQLFSSPPRQSYMPVAIPQDVPAYKIKSGKFYVDDELLPEGTFITFEGEPNVEMEPMNTLAFDKMREYLAKLDVMGRKKADRDEKAYVSLLESFDHVHSYHEQGGKKVAILNREEDVPLMGGKKRGRPRIEKIEIAAVDEASRVHEVGKKAVSNG